jgi:hypothetical protein
MEQISEFPFSPMGPISGRKWGKREMLGRLAQMSENESRRAKRGEKRGRFGSGYKPRPDE